MSSRWNDLELWKIILIGAIVGAIVGAILGALFFGGGQ